MLSGRNKKWKAFAGFLFPNLKQPDSNIKYDFIWLNLA